MYEWPRTLMSSLMSALSTVGARQEPVLLRESPASDRTLVC